MRYYHVLSARQASISPRPYFILHVVVLQTVQYGLMVDRVCFVVGLFEQCSLLFVEGLYVVYVDVFLLILWRCIDQRLDCSWFAVVRRNATVVVGKCKC